MKLEYGCWMVWEWWPRHGAWWPDPAAHGDSYAEAVQEYTSTECITDLEWRDRESRGVVKCLRTTLSTEIRAGE